MTKANFPTAAGLRTLHIPLQWEIMLFCAIGKQADRLPDSETERQSNLRQTQARTARLQVTQRLFDSKADKHKNSKAARTPDSKLGIHTDSHLLWGRSGQFPAEGPWSRSRYELGRLFRWTANPQQPAKRLPWRQRGK